MDLKAKLTALSADFATQIVRELQRRTLNQLFETDSLVFAPRKRRGRPPGRVKAKR